MTKSGIIRTVFVSLCLLALVFAEPAGSNQGRDFLCGDTNNDGEINILDIIFLIIHLYQGGPAPEIPESGDVNMSESINILDITYLIAFLYQGGPDPTCFDPGPGPDPLPETYDLRNVDGSNYVTSVKAQLGGTCWAHGTMGSVESNLLMTGAWAGAGETGEPNLAEYHLDWWNGFNDHWNPEIDSTAYVFVHDGGDFQMSSAYFSRGDGAVRDIDGQSYYDPPEHYNDSFHYFYVRDIEWYSPMMWEEGPSNIDLIKTKIMEYGAIGTCMNTDYIDDNYICYVPPSADAWSDHIVTIVGWSDNITTPAPEPGAWLCKNSWGATWGYDGYFWISYYDKICGRQPGSVVGFHNVEPLIYDRIYVHDMHGWWGNMWNVYEAFNAFTTVKNEILMAVNIVTLEDSVDYTVTIYDTFNGINLSDELTSFSGMIEIKGFHTLDLPTPLELSYNNDFYIHLQISGGMMPYDYSTYVEHMPGTDKSVFIKSKGYPKQSYYLDKKGWNDLYYFDQTANFCIKGLAVSRSLKVLPEDSMVFDGPQGGPIEPASGYTFKFTHRYDDPIDYQINPNPDYEWLTITGDISGSLAPNDTGEVTVTVNASLTTGLTQGQYNGVVTVMNLDHPEDDIDLELKLKLGTPTVQEEWLLDSDPGWTCEGDWAFGSPTGGGGSFGYGTDPVGGYTGDNVYGYNIDGNYPPVLPETHLTSEPIDCSKLFKVRLDFMRWLATDVFGYGRVKVSNDGINWETIWSGNNDIIPSWEETDLDISHIADFQPTVYLRWTMVVEGNPVYTFGGWSIDDIKIIGVYDSTMTPSPSADRTDFR